MFVLHHESSVQCGERLEVGPKTEIFDDLEFITWNISNLEERNRLTVL